MEGTDMKKKFLTLLIIVFSLLATVGVVSPLFAQDKPIQVYIDDVKINFTNSPILEHGRTLVEFRPIFDHLGFLISWDDVTKTITGEKEGLKITLKLNSNIAYINGAFKQLDVTPKVINGRTMIPLRFVSEASGGAVEWDSETQTVYIFFNIDEYLQYAAIRDDINKIKELIAEGANPNYKDKLGKTSLEWVIPTGKIETAKALIDGGANVNHVDDLGNSMLKLAVMYERPEMVQLLVDNNADINWKDRNGKTVLDFAQGLLELTRKEEDKLKIKAIIAILRNKIAELNNQSFELNKEFENKDEEEQNDDFYSPDVKDASDLARYLNNKYGSLDTPVGKWTFEFEVDENDSKIFPYDFWIKTDWYNENGVGPYELKYSIKISDEDKKETLELLKELQINVARDAMKLFPKKKIQGGYYSGFYKYPSLRVGYESIRFMSWKNYEGDILGGYDNSVITEFHWDDDYDDYNFIDENN
jgi:hypothetical protein